jgi:hypothetical protein
VRGRAPRTGNARRTRSGARTDRLAQSPTHDIEDLFHVAIGIAPLGGMADATLDVVLEDQQRDRVDRRPQGCRLLKDVDAIFPALDHALDTADLAGNSAQPPDQDRLVSRVGVPERRIEFGAVGQLARKLPGGGRGVVDAGSWDFVLAWQLDLAPCSVTYLAGHAPQPRWRANDTPGEYPEQRGTGNLSPNPILAAPSGGVQDPAERIDLEGGSARAVEHEPGGMTDEESTAYGFAHASEAEFARILDFYQMVWEYEPQVFPILWDLDGNVLESFAPDFFLPELGLFIELTTLQQRLVRKKNRKVRRLRELYPSLRIKLFYARDFRALMLKYGRSALLTELSGTLGQMGPHSELSDVDDSAVWPAGAAESDQTLTVGDPQPTPVRRSRASRRRAGRRAAAAAANQARV